MTEEQLPFPPYPNGWFRVAFSEDLPPGGVEALSFFGQDLVLFRDEETRPHVLDAHCRHLGAHLGIGGRVEGSGIRCPFHGWLWDGNGACAEIPYAKKVPPKAQMRAWTVVEKNGVIWVHHHMEGKPPSYEVPDIPELGSEEWTPMKIRRWKVRGYWPDINENQVDQTHFKYVHGTGTIPKTEVEMDGPILRCRSTMVAHTPRGEAVTTLETHTYGPCILVGRFSELLDVLVLSTVTPVDEQVVDVAFAYSVKKAGGVDAERGVGAAIIRNLQMQLDQDIPIWEGKKYWKQPLLCDGDGPIAAYRRWMRQFFSGHPTGDAEAPR